jgi:glutamyl/glutaminyl-tRNA synthetase
MMPAAERNRRRSAGEPYAMRLAMDAAVARAGAITWKETGLGPHGQTGVVVLAPQLWGDVVLARKDAPASYHLAVAVDDALQGVSDVVRGQDLFWSTSIHRVLQALLGLPEPTYHHHRLILDADDRKLSKSTQATSPVLHRRSKLRRKFFRARRTARLHAETAGDLRPVHFGIVQIQHRERSRTDGADADPLQLDVEDRIGSVGVDDRRHIEMQQRRRGLAGNPAVSVGRAGRDLRSRRPRRN